MLFPEMVKSLIDGKYCTRELWLKTGEYLALMPNMDYIWNIKIQNIEHMQQLIFHYAPTIADLQADDWIELQEKK